MATSAQLKSSIKQLEAAIKSNAVSKENIDKFKTQLDKAKSELAALQSPKSKKAAAKPKALTALQKLKGNIKADKGLSGYKKPLPNGEKIDIEKDAEIPAMPTGRRVSKGLRANKFGSKSENKGKVYYEYRLNRADVKQPPKKYPKLEDGGIMARGGFITDLSDAFASDNLKQELNSKMKIGDPIVAFAYTDYGGNFFDKVAIAYFEENHPENIVSENTGYSGQNGIVFGEPAKEFLEVAKNYLLGYEDIESLYYEMQSEQEHESFEQFLNDIKSDYVVKKGTLDWLMNNKGGYYSMQPNMLDFSYEDLQDELEEEGLITKINEDDEYAKGGKLWVNSYDDDKREKALHQGKRISQGLTANKYGTAAQNKGNVYYENRLDHADVDRRRRLEDGGMMEGEGLFSEGGNVPKKKRLNKYQKQYNTMVDNYKWFVVDLENKKAISGWEYKEDAIDALNDYDGDTNFKIVSERMLKSMDVKNPKDDFKYAGGGMMAKGGKIKVRLPHRKNKIIYWELDEIINEINRDRSPNLADFDKSNWQEGWNQWLEGGFYSLNDVNGKPLNNFADGGYMAKGGSISKFNPMELIGRTFWAKHNYGEIVDVRVIAEDNIKVKYETSKGTYSVEKSFTKKELFDMSNGKVINGDEILKMSDGGYMAKGGLTEHGLKIGDLVESQEGDYITVKNNNKFYVVDLNSGYRTMGIKNGGMMEGDEYAKGGKLWVNSYDDDKREKALHQGKRISQGLTANKYGTAAQNKGNVYYENRLDHADVDRRRRLEDGGYTDDISNARLLGRNSQDWHSEAREYLGSDYDTATKAEIEEVITMLQKDWDRNTHFAKGGKLWVNSYDDDKREKALHQGKRISQGLTANKFGTAAQNKGNVYYENRLDHADVDRRRRLEDGGELHKLEDYI